MSSMKNIGPNTLVSLEGTSIELKAVQLEAIEWHERLSGDTSAKTEQAFDHWMATSEEHRQAYLEAELLADGLAQLAAQPKLVETLTVSDDVDQPPSLNLISLVSTRQPVKWLLSAMAVAACVAMVTVLNLAWFGSQVEPSQVAVVKTFQTQYLSSAGELRKIALPDGSKLTLGPNSLINVSYSESSRKIELVLGEVYFDVTKSNNRPFFVEAEQTSVKVVGTRFDVRRLAESTSVSVVEGIVQVFNGRDSARLRSNSALPTTVLAGQHVRSDGSNDIVVQEALGEQDLVAWLDGRLVYRGAELRDVLADANRYSKSRTIRLDDMALGEKKVTLSVSVDSIDDLPLMLAELMSLDINQSSFETVLSIKR
ncbi:MAG: FecR domain-containing protein [Arenicella sp.]|nr:FecR domain-containing protein [Arenicella sp.]